MLDQYRKVLSERDAAERRFRASSDEAQALRGELIATDGDRKQCLDKISVLEREASDHSRVIIWFESYNLAKFDAAEHLCV